MKEHSFIEWLRYLKAKEKLKIASMFVDVKPYEELLNAYYKK